MRFRCETEIAIRTVLTIILAEALEILQQFRARDAQQRPKDATPSPMGALRGDAAQPLQPGARSRRCRTVSPGRRQYGRSRSSGLRFPCAISANQR